jgi:excisionase family DNA binding protein
VTGPESELQQLLTLDDVSQYLGIPKSTLYCWRVDGRGPKALKVGKYLRYRHADVEAWLDGQVDGR